MVSPRPNASNYVRPGVQTAAALWADTQPRGATAPPDAAVVHDFHPMEVDANRRAGLPDDWRR